MSADIDNLKDYWTHRAGTGFAITTKIFEHFYGINILPPSLQSTAIKRPQSSFLENVDNIPNNIPVLDLNSITSEPIPMVLLVSILFISCMFLGIYTYMKTVLELRAQVLLLSQTQADGSVIKPL